MASRPFVQVDVFADRPGAGNPLAVLPDARGLDEAAMQAIARWTRLPETTFVFPPTRPGASYAIRMFSPKKEVPFAGHPSVGTAHVLLAILQSDPECARVLHACQVREQDIVLALKVADEEPKSALEVAVERASALAVRAGASHARPLHLLETNV